MTWSTRFPSASRNETIQVAIVLIGLIVFPFVVPSSTVSLGFVALHYAIFALGLNIVLGWTGLLDLGAAGFVAIGAYTTAIAMTRFGWPPLAVLPVTFALGFISGVLLGIPTLRHRLDYFAILTLGFAELVALSIRNWPSVTKGSFGYSGIPATKLPFLDEPLRAVPPIGFYFLALGVLVISYAFVAWLRSTALGGYFHVVKHDETVAHAYGINVLAVKTAAFGLSAGFLATGGFFWTTYQRSIVWTEFGVILSFMLVSVVVVGGLGNPRGVVLGAALIGCALEIIRRLLTAWGLPQETRFLIFAVTLILFVHLRHKGILVDRPKWLKRFDLTAGSPPTSFRDPLVTSKLAENDPLLEIENISKSFGGVVALDGLSIKIVMGECLAIVGPNGSGKTTLLNCISGFVRPDQGDIRLSGRRIGSMAPYRIARAGLGRSFQDLSVFEDISVRDNVYITSPRASRSQIKDVLNRFGLSDGSALTDSLSYGSKKALDLARLLAEPSKLKIVLLDEPTAGLTQQEASEVVETLWELRRSTGITTVVISHDVLFLESLNLDRVIVLHHGKSFKEGTFTEIRKDEDVRTLFWGEN